MFAEREVILKVLQGELRASEQLVSHYQRLVLHVVSRIIKQEDDVADVCQEVFIKVFNKLGTFNFQSKLGTWIARIAYLTALNYLRDHGKEKLKQVITEDEPLDNYYFTRETPEHILIKKDVAAYVQHLILQLPVQYRTVITLFHLEEFSHEEIGNITGMPEGTIKNYLFRARKLLKEKMDNCLKED